MTDRATSSKRVVLVGAGGHARSVLRALAAYDDLEIVCAVDDAFEDIPLSRFGIDIVGRDSFLPTLLARGVDHFAMGVGGIGNNAPRRNAFMRAVSAGLTPITVVDARAIVDEDAVLGSGAFVAAGAIICGGASVGANAIINTGAIVEHDCFVDDHAHVASGALLCGGVRVGREAHVGAGAVVRQYIDIGPGALIGAGAVVVAAVQDGAQMVGNPARRTPERRS